MKGVSTPGAGRPSTYKPELSASLRQHFERAAQAIDRQLTEGQIEGLVCPTFAGWCRAAGVTQSCHARWSRKEPEHRAAYEHARQIQKDLTKLARLWGLQLVAEK